MACSIALAKDFPPDPPAAFVDFSKYQYYAHNETVREKYIGRIEKDIGHHGVNSTSRDGKLGPILVLVYFARSNHYDGMLTYAAANDLLLKFIRAGTFSKHLYQYWDLHPDQASQGVWEMSQDNMVCRVEITPQNAVTVAFYTNGDFGAAMDLTRFALPLPPSHR